MMMFRFADDLASLRENKEQYKKELTEMDRIVQHYTTFFYVIQIMTGQRETRIPGGQIIVW